MTTIVTRAGKGSPLTWNEADANFNNLNTDKVEVVDLAANTGSSLVGFTNGGTGSVDTTVQSKLREIVSVTDFGAVGDDTTDDTAAIQAALDYLVANITSGPTTSGALTTSYSGNSPRLHFPKGTYKITSALSLSNGYLEITGDQAIVKQYTVAEDIFQIEFYQLSINGMQFVGGDVQLNLYNDNINSSLISINECQFFLSRSYAINTYSGTPSFTHLSCDMRVSNSRFISCNKVLNNSCDNTTVANCWIQIDKNNFTASTAAILNKGATPVTDPDALTRLHLKDCFLIPDIGVEGVDRVDNVRWVDNYGSFTATHTRFGGENAGIPTCFHLGPPNTIFPWLATEVILKDCTLYVGPDTRTDSCVVGIQGEIPNRVAIRDCTGPVGKPFIANLSSTNITTYMSDFETATGFKAYEYFRVDVDDAITNISAFSPARIRIPDELYKYTTKEKQTRVSRATQSLSNGFANNLVSFDTITFDNVGAFDISTPTQIKMPNGCSKMRITAAIRIAVDGNAKTIAASIVTSGLAFVAGDILYRPTNPDSDAMCISMDVEGAPGSYWHINLQHNAPAALNLIECRVSASGLDFVG